MKHNDIWFIGDPHLGRKFETGVPLPRRGEREARQLAKFKAELTTPCEINIMVGDLFDHPQVSMASILEAADAYLDAAKAARPGTIFVAMAGNHDRSRQLGTVGAWEIFKRVVGKKILFVDTPQQLGEIVLFPWQWGITAIEQVEQFTPDPSQVVTTVVGHWDLQSFGGNDDHLAPTALLKERFPKLQKVISGHYHLEGTYQVGGIDVDCTGSLEPYTHAEDPTGELYVTLTLDELAERDDLRDKCVRVLLREGEELPHELDCLALTAKRVTKDEEESVADKLGAFDWQAILDEHLAEVPVYVREFIDERLIAHVS
jgi:hypothetical protein